MLIQGCGKVVKLLFACHPIDAMGAAATSREDGRKLRQQDRKFACERPRRIDDDEPASAEPIVGARAAQAEFGAQNLSDAAPPQAASPTS